MSELSDSARLARSLSTLRSSPMATIESSVTRLLVLTKHLLESLTQWARREADDKFVLDAYVKLGNDFRAAARSFTTAGVDILDLGDVPRALRIVLELALSEAPTQENLDRFLPNIRSIIVTLLLNLKAKQTRAKELAAEQSHVSTPSPQVRRSSEMNLAGIAPNSDEKSLRAAADNTSQPVDRPRRSKLLAELLAKASAEKPENSEKPETLEKTAENGHFLDPRRSRDLALASSEALAKLQKGNVILRRASKRFSAYQFAKLTNPNNGHVPRLSADLALLGETQAEAYTDTPVPVPSGENLAALDQPYIFLRIGDKTKKAYTQFPMTLAALRLLFVEKFAYSPKTALFPEIYVLDPRTNVSYELEEYSVEEEIKTGSLVLLKAASAQEESLKDLEESVHGLSSRMDSLALEVVQQVRSAIELAPISAQIAPAAPSTGVEVTKELDEKLAARNAALTTALKELQQELKSVRTVLNAREALIKELTAIMQGEIVALKEACLEESSPNKNRSFMEESYSKLSEDSDTLLTRVDDLQDMMEALRKDVAQRGVRLGAKQLKTTQKEIGDVKLQLSGLIDYIRDGKPTWKKIWESELDKVCEEQQFFNLQDDLTRDLDEDIRKIEETFDLIEKCSVHQSKQSLKKNVFASRMMLPDPGESVLNLRDAVLSEVVALKPDHEGRLDAIAKAERMRERERNIQNLDQFQEELGDFVDEKKLKSSGGIEELEKRRQQQDAENLKCSFGVV
ncbi:Actin interacting protein 3 [Metschnikowia aff. pulcherrima]|uniref:Actin interacting protein 3 n=1 Tax=Metschnikowia aff. pulcherrima TaxID=2163413 RepID=A0A4P6XRJ8_9ASCO|nr:Actin interacting protein 3 [Metschnikowia aff. pulcherrima]